MRSLASILDSLAEEGPGAGGRTLDRIAAVWPEVAGEGLAALARPAAFRDGELVVRVEHPAAAMEVRLRGGEIIEALNERLGARRVRRIVPAGRGRKKGS